MRAGLTAFLVCREGEDGSEGEKEGEVSFLGSGALSAWGITGLTFGGRETTLSSTLFSLSMLLLLLCFGVGSVLAVAEEEGNFERSRLWSQTLTETTRSERFLP